MSSRAAIGILLIRIELICYRLNIIRLHLDRKNPLYFNDNDLCKFYILISIKRPLRYLQMRLVQWSLFCYNLKIFELFRHRWLLLLMR